MNVTDQYVLVFVMLQTNETKFSSGVVTWEFSVEWTPDMAVNPQQILIIQLNKILIQHLIHFQSYNHSQLLLIFNNLDPSLKSIIHLHQGYIICMLKYHQLGVLKVLKYNLNNMLAPFRINRIINRFNQEYFAEDQYEKTIKTTLHDFQREAALLEWTTISDREIGGDSETMLLEYDINDPSIHYHGIVRTIDKDRLQSTPFIGLLQTKPLAFNAGLFNALRIEMKSDGKPIQIEMVVYSPLIGYLYGRSFIVSKLNSWQTYELPFRNFQILGEQAKTQRERRDPQRISMNKIIDQHLINPRKLHLQNFAMRFPSSEDCERSACFRKIELVRTIRGSPQMNKLYRKPYFYIVKNPNESSDRIFTKIDTGAFSTSPTIPPHLYKYV